MLDAILTARRRGAVLLAAALVISACSRRDDTPSDEPVVETARLEPLTDAELAGIPREQVVLALPWSEAIVSRDPGSVAARGTLQSVALSEAAGFDRAVFEFGDDAEFPGYRVAWNDSTTAVCGAQAAPDPGRGRTLLIRFTPARAHEDDGAKTVAETSRRPGLPSVATARQLCDAADTLAWALGAADSTRFRVVELRTPPRLLVDVLHAGAPTGLK